VFVHTSGNVTFVADLCCKEYDVTNTFCGDKLRKYFTISQFTEIAKAKEPVMNDSCSMV